MTINGSNSSIKKYALNQIQHLSAHHCMVYSLIKEDSLTPDPNLNDLAGAHEKLVQAPHQQANNPP